MVNNDQQAFPQETKGSHAWTEHTQTNRNGIIGKMYIEAKPINHITDIQISPNYQTKCISAKVKIYSTQNEKAQIFLSAEARNTKNKHNVKKQTYPITLHKGINNIELSYYLGKDALSWSEFDPTLYRLTTTLSTRTEQDTSITNFGLREFKTNKNQFTINGIKTFLRGKHDTIKCTKKSIYHKLQLEIYPTKCIESRASRLQ